MRISERLLTVLVLCLLAAAVPAFGRGSGELRLQQVDNLLTRAQKPLKEAQDLLARQPITEDEYGQAMKLIDQAMTFISPAMTLIDQLRKEHPDLPELPPMELKLAGALVEAKRYADAMTLLVQIMQDYPDLRVETDRLVARVMDVRRQFNDKYRALVTVLEQPSSEENTAKGLALVEELRKLDPNPDPAVKQSLDIALQSLENAKVMEEFLLVLKAAAEQLAAGRYADAISTYRNGFTVGRELFDKAAYSSLVRDPALVVVSDLDRTAQEAGAGLPGVLVLPAALEVLLAAPVTAAGREEFAKSLDLLAQAGNRESRLRTLGARIPELQSAIVLSRGGSGQSDFWLTLIGYSTMGRVGTTSEGLVYAARQPWVVTARKLSDTAVAAADAAAAKLTEAFARVARLAELRPLAEEARNRAALAIRVLEAEAPAWQEAGLVLGSEDAARSAGLPALTGRLRQHIGEADAWETFTVARDQATAATADLDRSLQAIQSAGGDAGALRTGRTATAALRDAAVAGAAAWNDRLSAAAAGSVIASQASTVRDGYAAIAARALDQDAALAHDLAALEAAGFSARLADAEGRRAQGRALAAGTATGQSPSGKRPDLGNDQYVRALSDIGVLLSDLEAWRARWTAEPAHASASAAMSAEMSTQAALRARIVALQTAIAADATAARTALALATQLRGQGDSAFQAGQGQEKAKKYNDALASYTTAQKSYEDSLDKQENAAARARLVDLPSIIEAIRTRAREQNLAEVQKLIDQGVQQFTDTDFETAIATLEAARALWEAAAGGTNPTIETFLDRATAALKVTGKQEIIRTDPIYEDIRGFMTPAELSYNTAVTLQKSAAGSAANKEYLAAIASARTSVQAITAVVPEYREARLLALKIDRLELGAEKFAAKLRERVDASLADARNSRSGEIVLRDAYYSLKDYKALDGIETILTAAKRREIDSALVGLEVALGLRPPPPDPKKVAESAAFFRQANTEYRKNLRDAAYAEAAMWLLELSLAANVLNTDAAKLRNEIVVKRGSSIDVLSPTELASYRTAIQDFTNRNYATAEARVDDLLQAKPRNPLLLDLKRQTQATR